MRNIAWMESENMFWQSTWINNTLLIGFDVSKLHKPHLRARYYRSKLADQTIKIGLLISCPEIYAKYWFCGSTKHFISVNMDQHNFIGWFWCILSPYEVFTCTILKIQINRPNWSVNFENWSVNLLIGNICEILFVWTHKTFYLTNHGLKWLYWLILAHFKSIWCVYVRDFEDKN